MTQYKSNLEARKIKLSRDDIYMIGKITERKLGELEVFKYLPADVKNIIKNNVLIVATTENIKRAEAKADMILGNLNDAIDLVMKDVKESSAQLLEG